MYLFCFSLAISLQPWSRKISFLSFWHDALLFHRYIFRWPDGNKQINSSKPSDQATNFFAFQTYKEIIPRLDETNKAALVISIICILTLAVFKEHIQPRFKKKFKVPFPIELIVVSQFIDHYRSDWSRDGPFSVMVSHITGNPTAYFNSLFRLTAANRYQCSCNYGLIVNSWWRHQMEAFSALLAFCAGNSTVQVNFPLKGQWRGAFMFSLIWTSTNGWVSNREAGDLRRHRAHYDVIVMCAHWLSCNSPRCLHVSPLLQTRVNFNPSMDK